MSSVTKCFRVEFIEAGDQEPRQTMVDYVLAVDVREAAGIIQDNYNVDRILEVVEVPRRFMDGHSEAEKDDDDGWTDVEADADILRNVGWGTDEDYGYYGGEYD